MSDSVNTSTNTFDAYEKKLNHYRLSREEGLLIEKALGRVPEHDVEWALFSALWSEHCSYKSSRIHLKKFFTQNACVVQGPGENAGVIDLGCGERVAFKMESHNHPSFIEPTQGAATGVGGILRDIFTMGARPIALMDYLCFGDVEHPLTPRLLDGVVKGIGGYGNCVGVPTVNGQTTFHKSYNGNNLVNAFALGLFRPDDKIFYGKAAGPGNLLVYAGAHTGRDGVHGASMASESFDEKSEAKKPQVQIGDPFYEKLLIEACLDVMKADLLVGIQDMGAAGLISSTFEMAARGQCGLRLDLDKVPLREPNIQPDEILLSESQERMVLVIEPKNLKAVKAAFARYGLECAVIGEVTDGGSDRSTVDIYWHGERLTSMSHKPLVDQAPRYDRPYKIPARPQAIVQPRKQNDGQALLRAWAQESVSADFASRDWITRQYDQRVGASTIQGCESDVALMRLADSGRVLGLTLGCRPALMEQDVTAGSWDALILPVLQQASRGVQTLACTDCLNFGNPEKPEIMGQFVESVERLSQACETFDVPVISGNVSFYNESQGDNIIPTPSIGVVGIRQEPDGPKACLGAQVATAPHQLLLVLTASLEKMPQWLPGQSYQPPGPEMLAQAKLLQQFLLSMSGDVAACQIIHRGGCLRALEKLLPMSVGFKLSPECMDAASNYGWQILRAEFFYAALMAVTTEKASAVKRVASQHRLTCLNFAVLEPEKEALGDWNFGAWSMKPVWLLEKEKALHVTVMA